MIQRIKVVHEARLIHRDIKPENFMIGTTKQNKNTIFIIDFGLAKSYKSSDGKHIPFVTGKQLTGTARYCSINTHDGYEQSRRDDLESIGHMLVYFIRGILPWQGLPGKTKNEKYHNIKRKKKDTPLDDLCADIPEVFKEYMVYCRGLKFYVEPDYDYLIGIFETCMKDNSIDKKQPDFIWNRKKNLKKI